MTRTTTDEFGPVQDRALRALNAMIANGAAFHLLESVVGPSFTFEVAGTGDRAACRKILSALKRDAAAFAAFRSAARKLAGVR